MLFHQAGSGEITETKKTKITLRNWYYMNYLTEVPNTKPYLIKFIKKMVTNSLVAMNGHFV